MKKKKEQASGLKEKWFFRPRTTVEAIRLKLGLTQQALADYLGILREIVVHVERDRRRLPPDLLLLLTPFMEGNEQPLAPASALNRALPAPPAGLADLPPALQELRYYYLKCTVAAQRLHDELVGVEVRHQQAQARRRLLPPVLAALEALAEPTDLDAVRRLLLARWLREADEWAATCAPTAPARLLLTLRAQGMAADTARAAELLRTLVPAPPEND